MTDSRSFFVDAQGDSPASTTTPPTLGHTEFRCHECGHPWHFGQSNCSKCNSMVFDEHVVAPALLERVGSTIRAVVTPAKPPPPRASAATLSELHGLQGDATALLSRLERLEVQLIAEVRGGCEELAPVQGLIHECCYTSGDVSRGSVRLLTLALRALGIYLDVDVKNIEDKPK
jgi:hypothetical protein